MKLPFLRWTSETLTADSLESTLERWISSLLDSRVNPSASPVIELVRMTHEINGQRHSDVLALFDPDTCSWKMYQGSLLTNTSEPFLGNWPRSGMIQNGVLRVRPALERHIFAKGSGYFPTPSTAAATQGVNQPDGKRGQTLIGAARKQNWPTPKSSPSGPDYARISRPKSGGDDLATAVARRFPTPTATDAIKRGQISPRLGAMGLSETIGGQLNPMWVEWLMGWPVGWTDLKPLEMVGSRKSWLPSFERIMEASK